MKFSYLLFNVLQFIQFCIKFNNIWLTHRKVMAPYMAIRKVLTSLISYGTKRRHKRGVITITQAQVLRQKFSSACIKVISFTKSYHLLVVLTHKWFMNHSIVFKVTRIFLQLSMLTIKNFPNWTKKIKSAYFIKIILQMHFYYPTDFFTV